MSLEIKDFTKEYITEAIELLKASYKLEKERLEFLPDFNYTADIKNDFESFSENGLGVCATIDGKLAGFICAYPPFVYSNKTGEETGCLSPAHGHAFADENNTKLMEDLYAAADEKWTNAGAKYQTIILFCHEKKFRAYLGKTEFEYSSSNCMQKLKEIKAVLGVGFSVSSLTSFESGNIRVLRTEFSKEMSEKQSTTDIPENIYEYPIIDKEDVATLGIWDKEKLIGFADIGKGGKDFISSGDCFFNIQRMYIKRKYRAMFITEHLINEAIRETRRRRRFDFIGVRCDLKNENASNSWASNFKAYTINLTRYKAPEPQENEEAAPEATPETAHDTAKEAASEVAPETNSDS